MVARRRTADLPLRRHVAPRPCARLRPRTRHGRRASRPLRPPFHGRRSPPCCPPADYPYPLDAAGKPIDTQEWRDVDKIDYHAPKPHEKNAPDNALFKAVREFEMGGMEGIEAAIAAGADLNAQDKVSGTREGGWPLHPRPHGTDSGAGAYTRACDRRRLLAGYCSGRAVPHVRLVASPPSLCRWCSGTGLDGTRRDETGRDWAVLDAHGARPRPTPYLLNLPLKLLSTYRLPAQPTLRLLNLPLPAQPTLNCSTLYLLSHLGRACASRSTRTPNA